MHTQKKQKKRDLDLWAMT